MTSSSDPFGSTTLGGTGSTTEGGYAAGYVPLTPQPPVGYDVTPPAQDEKPSTADVAKDQASNVAGGAADAAGHVADVAKDQVGQVTAEAGRQVKQLLGQAQSELSTQAQAQQEKLAGGLHSVGDQLKAMANNSDEPGLATDLAHQAADKAHQFAGWLDQRDPGSVLNEVRSYARQRPGTFLAIALGAGLVAGRLARGLAADPDDMSKSTGKSAPRVDSLTSGGTTAQLDPGMPTAGYPESATAGYGGLPLGAAGTASPEGDLYGTGAVPDWTGKPGSDVLGDAR